MKIALFFVYLIVAITQLNAQQPGGSLEDNTVQNETPFVRGNRIIFQDDFGNWRFSC